MSYLNERAEILKAELEFAEELHRKNPTTLSESYQKDAAQHKIFIFSS